MERIKSCGLDESGGCPSFTHSVDVPREKTAGIQDVHSYTYLICQMLGTWDSGGTEAASMLPSRLGVGHLRGSGLYGLH
jgi:hypothetical protein